MNTLPYGRQNVTEEDIQAVISVLKSEFLTQGDRVPEFEKAFASYIGCEYAVAVANGTAALHLAALALDITAKDKVITTPITFAASANCIRYCGGEVYFVDIDEDTLLIDTKKLRILIESQPRGTFSGIVPVDFSGRAVDLEQLRELADEYGLWILEDACHAPGGYFVDRAGNRQYCGNGRFADMSIFSFHPVKHIATGEGGMITTNNKELYEKLLLLRTHGITRDPAQFTNSLQTALMTNEPAGDKYPPWYMEMQVLGYNYRLTDIQAALGSSQLKRADAGLDRRRMIAKRYAEAFSGAGFIKRQSGYVDGHSYHLYILEVDNRLALFNYLRESRIYAQIHYVPCHLMPYYKQLGWKEGDMPVSENYYAGCISIPMYPTLTDEEQDYVIDKIQSFYA